MGSSSRGATAEKAFFGLLICWMLLPLLLWTRPANDIYPTLTAATLVPHRIDDIYIDEPKEYYQLQPAFQEAFCTYTAEVYDDAQCHEYPFAFVNPPPALLPAMPLTHLGLHPAIFLTRIGAALAFAVGMWVLWRRLAHRHPRAPETLALTALFLTPFVALQVGLVQSAPALFILGALGLTAADRPRRRAVAALILVIATVAKLFAPTVLWVPLVHRRWKYLAAVVGVGIAVLAISSAFLPLDMWPKFFKASQAADYAYRAYPQNGSFDAAVLLSGSTALESGTARALSLLVRLAAVGTLGWWAVRKADPDTQWAWTLLATLVMVPVVWGFYLSVAIPAFAFALAAHRKIPTRWLASLPITALALTLISYVGTAESLAFLRFGALAAAVIASAVLARGSWASAVRTAEAATAAA